MTLPELIEDIEQQFSECPCGDCLAKIDYDCSPPFGRSNNGELLFPDVRPVYFYCAIKDETLNTDEMKGKQCNTKRTRHDQLQAQTIQKRKH
jgi:hypothetical protein